MSKRQWSEEELSLLRAIHENPRDDAPRLTYAGWLEENEQREYGEFIRLQLRGHQDGESGDREDELWRVHQEEWARPMPGELRTGGVIGFHRGLPMPWIYPRRCSVARLDRLLAAISPRCRPLLLLGGPTLLHPQAGAAAFGHPLLERASLVRVTWTHDPAQEAAILRAVASLPLPPGAEEIQIVRLSGRNEPLAQSLFEPRFPVRRL